MKAVVAAFNQEKALVGAFSVITNLRMELFEALVLVLVLPMPIITQYPVDTIIKTAERWVTAAAEMVIMSPTLPFKYKGEYNDSNGQETE